MRRRDRLDRRGSCSWPAARSRWPAVAWAGQVLLPRGRGRGRAAGPLPGRDRRLDLPAADARRSRRSTRTSWRPAPFTTYIFGFRNVTGLTDAQRTTQKNKAQHSAPLFWVDQYDPDQPGRLQGPADQPRPGAAARPVRRAHAALARLPQRHPVLRRRADRLGGGAAGRDVHLRLPAPRPGTYMYHCHVEDVEHVHMGMTGLVFVRPLQDGEHRRLHPSSCTTTATARPASTASSRCSCRRCGPRRTGPTPTSSCRSGATTGPTSAC